MSIYVPICNSFGKDLIKCVGVVYQIKMVVSQIKMNNDISTKCNRNLIEVEIHMKVDWRYPNLQAHKPTNKQIKPKNLLDGGS